MATVMMNVATEREGLCADCQRCETCALRKPDGGIWSCSEYEPGNPEETVSGPPDGELTLAGTPIGREKMITSVLHPAQPVAETVAEEISEQQLRQVRMARPAAPQQEMELLCPYCGIAYRPKQGCFCFRLVPWNEMS